MSDARGDMLTGGFFLGIICPGSGVGASQGLYPSGFTGNRGQGLTNDTGSQVTVLIFRAGKQDLLFLFSDRLFSSALAFSFMKMVPSRKG